MEFCDEFDEVALNEGYPQARLTGMCIMFPPRVGQAGFRLDTFTALNKYLMGRVNTGAFPPPARWFSPYYPGPEKAPSSAHSALKKDAQDWGPPSEKSQKSNNHSSDNDSAIVLTLASGSFHCRSARMSF